MQVLVHVVLYMYTEKCKKCRARVHCVGICKHWCTSYKPHGIEYHYVCMLYIDCNGPEIDVILDHIPHSAKLAISPCIIPGT